jgi:transcriptional regulator GlxA family with amidase domain
MDQPARLWHESSRSAPPSYIQHSLRMRIHILLHDGFDELDALGPYRALHVAIAHGAAFVVNLVRLGSGTVTSACGLQVHVPLRADVEAPPDLVVVPGSGWLSETPAGEWAMSQRERLGAALAGLHAAGAVMAGVGSGTVLLGAGGFLSAVPVAAQRGAEGELSAAGARLVRARVVDAGTVITAAGLTAGFDLALWLVERFADSRTAHEVEETLGFERRGVVWRL